jgi:hypothetical protein
MIIAIGVLSPYALCLEQGRLAQYFQGSLAVG